MSVLAAAFARWERFWFSPRADVGRRLGLTRLLLGVAALLKLTGLYGCVERSLVGTVRWGVPHHVYGRGRFGFDDMPSPLWEHIPRLSLAEHRTLETAALVLALCFCVGLAARASGALLGTSFLWMVTFDIGAFKHNTFTLGLACLLVGLSPCADAFALDAVLKRALGRVAPPVRSALPVRLLQVWVCAIYLFATLAKLNASWWSGKFFEHVILTRRVDPGPLLPLLESHALHVVLGVSTLLLEGFLSFALLVPRLRRVALLLGAAFHLTLEVTSDVGAYTWTMLALYALFLERDDLSAARAWASSARGRRARPRKEHPVFSREVEPAVAVDVDELRR